MATPIASNMPIISVLLAWGIFLTVGLAIFCLLREETAISRTRNSDDFLFSACLGISPILLSFIYIVMLTIVPELDSQVYSYLLYILLFLSLFVIIANRTSLKEWSSGRIELRYLHIFIMWGFFLKIIWDIN